MSNDISTATRATLADLSAIVGALSLHVSTDPNRLGLTCILFTANDIIATDSYTAAIFTPITPLTTGEEMLINGRELLAAVSNAVKTLKRDGEPTVDLVSDGHRWVLTATGANNSTTATGKVFDGLFPNVGGIMANTKDAKLGEYLPTGVNADYLGRISDAHNKLCGKRELPLVLSHWVDPSKPMLWHTLGDTGRLDQLLMPVRLK